MPGLSVGDLDDYDRGGFLAYVSATKSVHKDVVGAERDHPDYIFKERPHHLILNWVDGPARLYDWSGPEMFTRVNDFIERHLASGNEVLVHCDQGLSRSPTLAMVYLSKRAGVLPEGFMDAYHAFRSIYPDYQPGGILDYVKNHWDEIR